LPLVILAYIGERYPRETRPINNEPSQLLSYCFDLSIFVFISFGDILLSKGDFVYTPFPQIWFLEKTNENYGIILYNHGRTFGGLKTAINADPPQRIYAAKNVDMKILISCLSSRDYLVRFEKTPNNFTALDCSGNKLFTIDENDFRFNIRERAYPRMP
jgi:hypothetical protein